MSGQPVARLFFYLVISSMFIQKNEDVYLHAHGNASQHHAT